MLRSAVRGSALMLGLVTLAFGCAEPTSILVEVTSTLEIPGDADTLELVVTGQSTGAVTEQSFSLESDWPHTVSIRPGEVESMDITIEVRALLAGAVVRTRTVSASFVDGMEVVVRVDLDGVDDPDAGSGDAGFEDAGELDGAIDAGPPADGGPDSGPEMTYTVGGTVTGLEGSGLVLQNNAGDDLSVSADGAFTFLTALPPGAGFDVTVSAQPSSPTQTCRVSGASGIIDRANVTSVVVNCAADAFTIGGTVAGLDGTVVLQNSGGDDLVLTSNGSFAFPTPVMTGADYAVTVLTQPSGPAQTCTVSAGMGTVAGGDVTTVMVDCVTDEHSLGGTVTGLTGSGLVLVDGASFLSITAAGAFTFPNPVTSGSSYSVTVLTQPTNPSQTCVVTNGSGTVGAADVTDIVVSCTTDTFTVGGTVSGLTGSGLVLRNNGGDDLAIAADGSFTFASPVASGAGFAVTVGTSPSSPMQTCSVSAGVGTVAASNITGVMVTCSVDQYTVGGAVSGLAGSGLVLRNNGGDDLVVSSNGSFTFSTSIAGGAGYAVTVASQPSSPSQTCVVGNGVGTVGAANVTSVTITCTTSYSVSVAVSGLTGSGLVLQNSGGDDLAISGNGSFTFATRLTTGAGYLVTVSTRPSSPAQTCIVGSGVGTIGSADITDVTVVCTVNQYTIGGMVSGLTGSGLVLRNGGENLPVGSDGTFSFSTTVAAGGSYAVTAQAQPSGPTQTCVVSNGTGPVVASNITSVVVMCTTNAYTIGGTVTMLSGPGMVLQNNGGDDRPIAVAGAFTFSATVLSGASYAVTISTQPTMPAATCAVSSGSGTVTNANITDVVVRCGDHRIFVTSSVHTGALGGLTGADAICQGLADAESLGGTWMAWLSDTTGSPDSRMNHGTMPYILVDGTRIADDWADLTDGNIDAMISLDETGAAAPASTSVCSVTTNVWSNTLPSGLPKAGMDHCNDWSGTGMNTHFGDRGRTTGNWSDRCTGMGGTVCTGAWTAPLYCVEQ